MDPLFLFFTVKVEKSIITFLVKYNNILILVCINHISRGVVVVERIYWGVVVQVSYPLNTLLSLLKSGMSIQ